MQRLREPSARKLRNALQRSGLLEEVRRSRHDLELHLTAHLLHRIAIHLNHRRIEPPTINSVGVLHCRSRCSAVTHIPFGGGKGGIICDPTRMPRRELEALIRRVVAEIIDATGPEEDVPDPDVNTNDQVMAWVMDTYSMHVGHTSTAVVTGKPLELGGSVGRREAPDAA